ncbi:hypothetical protein GCM10029963_26050 [Micromonospora andamanensis]
MINCAGPFASTAAALVAAALRAGIPYVDVAAEIEANLDTFRHFAAPAAPRASWWSPRWPSSAVSATCW